MVSPANNGTSPSEKLCGLVQSCESNHSSSGNAVNFLTAGIFLTDADVLGRSPSFLTNWELWREVFAVYQKKLEWNCCICTWLKLTQKAVPRAHLGAALPEHPSPWWGQPRSVLRANISVSAEVRLNQAESLPPTCRAAPTWYHIDAFNLSLTPSLKPYCLPQWTPCERYGLASPPLVMLDTCSSSCTATFDLWFGLWNIAHFVTLVRSLVPVWFWVFSIICLDYCSCFQKNILTVDHFLCIPAILLFASSSSKGRERIELFQDLKPVGVIWKYGNMCII